LTLVGLTGGIATGKSAVAKILSTLGARVVDADDVAREVVAAGSEALADIIDAFGARVLLPSGDLDRQALGAIVFDDLASRRKLEGITHPKIHAEINARIQAAQVCGAPTVFVEAALLVETGSANLYPHLWVVTCSETQQIRRLTERKGCDSATAMRWIEAQMPMAEKASHATQVIDNSGELKDLEQTVHKAYALLKGSPSDLD